MHEDPCSHRRMLMQRRSGHDLVRFGEDPSRHIPAQLHPPVCPCDQNPSRRQKIATVQKSVPNSKERTATRKSRRTASLTQGEPSQQPSLSGQAPAPLSGDLQVEHTVRTRSKGSQTLLKEETLGVELTMYVSAGLPARSVRKGHPSTARKRKGMDDAPYRPAADVQGR